MLPDKIWDQRKEKRIVHDMGMVGWVLLISKENTDWNTSVATVSLLCQIWIIQFSLVYFLWTHVRDHCSLYACSENKDKKRPPMFMLLVSLYVHVISCLLLIAQAAKPFRTLVKSRKLRYILLGFMDAWVIPILTLVAGGLFLCTSDEVSDLILNSCAVVFIPQIDDWFVSLMCHTLGLHDIEVELDHVCQKKSKWMTWVLLIVPVVPMVITAMFYIVDIKWMHLECATCQPGLHIEKVL